MNVAYRRLDPAKQEVRLLELQPARNISDPIDSRMLTARLTDKPDFIALSSLYGDTTNTEKIWVSNRPVAIPVHLVEALKHIRAVFYPTISCRYQRQPARRPHKAPRWLRLLLGVESSKDKARDDANAPRTLRVWVDLLCVNQRDDWEKSRQATELRNVFRSAELVVGWLGVKREHTDAAMSTLADIEDAMPPGWGDPGDREANPDDYSPTHRWAECLGHLWADGPNGEVPFTLPHWIGCNDFMGRQYFQRRWILEEISRARYPTFLIGDIIVPWKQVLRLNRMMEEFKYNPSNVWPPHLSAMIAELPLETAHKLLDEFAKREALEEARLLQERGSSRATSSTRSTDT